MRASLKILGHRGLAGAGAENSVVSARAAMSAGLDGVEVDIRQTVDDRLVLSHDPAHGGLQIESHTLDELRASEPIDTLGDLVGALSDGLLNLEVKAPVRDQTALASSLAMSLASVPRERVLISSFFVPLLEALMPLGYPVGVLTSPWYDQDASVAIDHAKDLGASVALPNDASVTDASLLQAAADAGIAVFVWTVNDPGRARSLQEAGAAGIITDAGPNIIRALG